MNKIVSPQLYDFIKKKIDFSEFLSTEIGCHLRWYEPKISAGTICPLPNHKDTKPSFRIKYVEENSVWIWNCLSGDTGVLTWNGTKPIRELAGTTQKILTSKNKWVDAPFYSFGKQNVLEILISRNSQKKIIRATPDHRWLIKCGKNGDRNKEIFTKDLRPNMRFSWMFPENKLKQIAALSPQGITHGIVFGDDSCGSTQSYVQLWGNKDKELLKWFPLNRVWNEHRPNGLEGIRVLDMPLLYKKFPPLDESPCYLAGFLAGWFAADGCVDDEGTILLNSSKKENLEYARMIATRLGIGTYGVTSRYRKGIDGKMSYIYNLHFITEDFNEGFFLISRHRERFKNSHKKWIRRSWVIKSITNNSIKEEVFCAVVKDHRCFTLEDNILTGNCLGCNAKGTIIDFCMEYYGLNSPAEAALFLCDKFGFKKTDIVVTDGIKDIKKQVNLQKKINCANIIASRQCYLLLKKDYSKYNKWVKESYKILNKSLDTEDLSTVESIGFEASKKIQETL